MSILKRRKAWWAMVYRCTNPDAPAWKYYGGRGITVDPLWLSFDRYYADTGEPPSEQHTLDRIDNEKGYGPDNWRWATKAEQSQNRRYCHRLTYAGKTQTASEWARELGMKVETVIWRVKKGWDIENILDPDAATYHRGKLVTVDDVSKSVAEWSNVTGVSKRNILARLSRGWPPRKAVGL